MAATARLLPAGWTTRALSTGATVPVPPRPDFTRPLEHVMTVRTFARAAKSGERAAPAFNEIDLVGSAETVDSYDTVFIQSGMDDRRFGANPIFLRQHEGDELPLGTCVDWWNEEIEVRVRGQRKRVAVPATVFRVAFDFGEDPALDDDWQKVARAYHARYMRGVLRGASIRFMVPPGGAEWGSDMTEEARAQYGISEWGIVFRKWELVELSAVTVPSNEHALARSASCNESEIARLAKAVEVLTRHVDELRSLAGQKTVEAPPAPERAADPASPISSPESASHAEGATPEGGPSEAHLNAFARQLMSAPEAPTC